MSKIIKIKSGAIKFTTGTPQIRVEKCTQAVQEVCEHFECMLIPSITTQGNDIVGYRTHGDVGIMPVPEKSRIIAPGDAPTGKPTVH